MTARRCPSKKEIVRYLEEGARDESRQELLDHIAACPKCRVVFEASLEVGSEAEALVRGLEGMDLGSPEAARRLKILARREIRILRREKSRGRRAYPRWLAVPAAGAALVLVAVLILVPDRRADRTGGTERGAATSEVGLMRPRGEVPSAGLSFQWTREPAARDYRLEIYDRTLEPVYQSAPLTTDRVALPDGALRSLERGAVYFWKIVVTLENGQTIESEFAAFTVQK